MIDFTRAISRGFSMRFISPALSQPKEPKSCVHERDIDIVRDLLLRSEAADGQVSVNDPLETYHVRLMLDAGLIDAFRTRQFRANIITGTHDNALLLPARALVVDQALIVKRGLIQCPTVKIGYRTLDFSEVLSGVLEGERVVLSDQDKLRPGRRVGQRVVKVAPRVDIR